MTKEKKQIWGSHLGESPEKLMVEFCAGRDVSLIPMADAELVPFDLWTNRAHSIMLHRQGIMTTEQLRGVLDALATLEADWQAGKFQLDPALEDVHMNIERFVTEKAGAEAGGRTHTGRSRNDQVACDMRLYMRSALLDLGQALTELADQLLPLAREHSKTVLPGFSHHQPAMITSWGHWLCAYNQAILRDLERVRHGYDLVNRNPLGAAAGFGTSWPIDREHTTELLAFARVDLNTLDCISSRWEQEAQVAQIFGMVMNHLSLMAQDLILLSHPYWGMVTLPDSYVTGSSIMPQKRNPDFAEVVKGKTAWVHGIVAGLTGLPRAGMSGYNRDSQLSKYAVMDVVRECRSAPTLMQGAFANLRVNEDVMRERLGSGFLMAADFADALARTLGLPFRTCYNIAADAVGRVSDGGIITAQAAAEALTAAGQPPEAAQSILDDLEDPQMVVNWRQHSGAPAHFPVRVQAETMASELATISPWIAKEKKKLDAAYQACQQYVPEI